MRKLWVGAVLVSGCMTVSPEQAAQVGVQRFQSGGTEFLVNYRVFEATTMEVWHTDGTAGSMSVPEKSVVLVSRADGVPFGDTRADERVARGVALSYCEHLGLGLGDVPAITTKFGPQTPVDNAEWRIYNVCAKPN